MKPKNLKEKILSLSREGKSNAQIVRKLSCSKQIVHYHLTPGYKEKVVALLKKNRKTKEGRLKKLMRQKYENFNKRVTRYKSSTFNPPITFSFMEFMDKITANPTCYITGRTINLEDASSYHIDHIIPVSKGGSNDLSNLGLACKEANLAKGNLLMPELISLCREIINKQSS